MLKSKDIHVGMKLFVHNCNTKKVSCNTIVTLNINSEAKSLHYVKLNGGIYGELSLIDLLRMLNTDTAKDPMFYGLKPQPSSKHRFYISLSEKDAYRHLAENVFSYDIVSLETEAETIRQDYMNCVDKLGAVEKEREELRLKYSKL